MSKPGKLYCLFLCMFLLMSAYVYGFNLLGQRKNNVFEFFISFCVNFHEDFFENFWTKDYFTIWEGSRLKISSSCSKWYMTLLYEEL